MNENQRPWCRCHNEKTLHYFFRETTPSLKTGKTIKHLMTACHECGSPGNQAVKKTPEMRQDWLDALPVLNMNDYKDYRYWIYDEPRPYTIGSQLNKKCRPLQQQLDRLRKDRRTDYGLWVLYEKGYEPNPFFGTPFEEHWKQIKSGFLKFPADTVDARYLFETALRRAEHAKHPHTFDPICESPGSGESFYPTQFFYRRDIDTKYIAYLVCVAFNENYLVKTELDLDHVLNAEIQTILKVIPEWTGEEIFLTPAEEIAEAENIEADYLDELKEDACAASGTGEFADWYFDPELGEDK